MRYLAKAESHKVKAKADAVQWKKKPAGEAKIGEHAVSLETKIIVNASEDRVFPELPGLKRH